MGRFGDLVNDDGEGEKDGAAGLNCRRVVGRGEILSSLTIGGE